MGWFGDILNTVLPIGGAIVGGVTGGPGGAIAGYTAGKSLSGGIGGVLGSLVGGGSTGQQIGSAGGLNALTGVAGAYLGSQAYKDAANTANDRLNPYQQTGLDANNKLAGLAGLNGADMQSYLQSMPGYQFALTQGLKSVQNNAAARGLGESGAALKGAAQYATGLADQTYNNNFNNLLKLSSLGQDTATKMGNINIGQGINTANAYTAGANAIQGGFNSIPAGNYYNQLLQGMYGNGTNGGTGANAMPSGYTDLGTSMPWLNGNGGTLPQGYTDLGTSMPWIG